MSEAAEGITATVACEKQKRKKGNYTCRISSNIHQDANCCTGEIKIVGYIRQSVPKAREERAWQTPNQYDSH